MTKIPRPLFLVFCLFLTNLLIMAYAGFVRYFQSGYEVKKQVQVLEGELSRSQFEKRVVHNQLLDLQQTIAEVMPSQEKMIASKWAPRALDLSQQLRSPASVKPLNLSRLYFEKGKKFFNEGKYKLAQRQFEALQEQFPTSDRVIESTFLVLESAYLQKDFKKAMELAESMVSQFPESPLTGYGLIRLAQISESNNQFEEAAVLYRLIRTNFADKKLQDQARVLEKRIGIE